MTDHHSYVAQLLGALTSGAESANSLAMRIGLAPDQVAGVLERSVQDGLVSRIELGGTPVYRLTPQGVELVGAALEADPVHERDGSMPSVPPAPVPDREVPGRPNVAVPASLEPVRAEPPTPARSGAEPTRASITWRHVVYAVAYVVVGLFVMLELSVVIGALAVLAGLAIGAFSLRPMWHAPERTGRLP